MRKQHLFLVLSLLIWALLFFQPPRGASPRSPVPFRVGTGAALAAGEDRRPSLPGIQSVNGICDTSIAATKDGLIKPNQSKVFYFDATWWMIAKNSSDDWTIWRYESGRDWTAGYSFSESSKSYPDAYVDFTTRKLYLLFSRSSDSKFYRMNYDETNRGWVLISSHTVSGVRTTNSDPASLVRAKNGEFWAFMAVNSTLTAVHSVDDGVTWSSGTSVSTSLSADNGLTDAVAFTDSSGENYLAVGVGCNTTSSSRFHFFLHNDADPDASWSDESSHVGPLQSEDSDDHVALAVDRANAVYMITKTHGSGPANALYKRSAGGSWQSFTVNDGNTWTRPAVVVDFDHDSLYVLGSETNDRVEYKRCKVGEESTLNDAGLLVPVLENGGDYMVNLSVPFHAVYDSTEFFVIADNSDRGDVWFARIPIGADAGCPWNLPPIDTTIHDLRIQRSGSDAVLSWASMVAADSFVLYRGTQPMFVAADSSRIAVTGDTVFTDAGVLDDPAVSHYYRLRAYVGGAAGPLSGRVGAYEYRLLAPAGKRNNFIAVCLNDTSLKMASDLAARIGPNCDLVSRWVETSQAYSSFVPGIPALDFALEVNEVYMVSVVAEDTLCVLGGVIETHQYSLMTTGGKNNNGIMLLMDADSLKTASALVASIGPVDLVSQWMAGSQAFSSYIPGIPELDFPIKPGQALMVSVTQDTTWPGR